MATEEVNVEQQKKTEETFLARKIQQVGKGVETAMKDSSSNTLDLLEDGAEGSKGNSEGSPSVPYDSHPVSEKEGQSKTFQPIPNSRNTLSSKSKGNELVIDNLFHGNSDSLDLFSRSQKDITSLDEVKRNLVDDVVTKATKQVTGTSSTHLKKTNNTILASANLSTENSELPENKELSDIFKCKEAIDLYYKIVDVANYVSEDNFMDVSTSLTPFVNIMWHKGYLSVFAQLLFLFQSNNQYRCIVICLALLKSLPLTTVSLIFDDLKSHKDVARKVHAFSRCQDLENKAEDEWSSVIVRLAKDIVNKWKRTVIESSKSSNVEGSQIVMKRSRANTKEDVKKKLKPSTSSAQESRNIADAETIKAIKNKEESVALSDDALFGSSVSNISIFKRNMSSKLSDLSTSPVIRKKTTKQEESVPLESLSEGIKSQEDQVSATEKPSSLQEDSRSSNASKLLSQKKSGASTSKKRVQFAPAEKLVTVYKIENIDQLRQWEREEAGLSINEELQMHPSELVSNESFEEHKKREREMEKSVFQAKSEHFVKAMREMQEEIEWSRPLKVSFEHPLECGVESVERVARERSVQLLPQAFSDRSMSPSSPEYQSVELPPLKEIPLESRDAASHNINQMSTAANEAVADKSAHAHTLFNAVVSPVVQNNNNNNNLVQLLQQNPSILQSLLSTLGSISNTRNSNVDLNQPSGVGSAVGDSNVGTIDVQQLISSNASSFTGTNALLTNTLSSLQNNMNPVLLSQLSQQSFAQQMNQQGLYRTGTQLLSASQLPLHNAAKIGLCGNVQSTDAGYVGNNKRTMDDKSNVTNKKSNVCYFYNQGTCANGDSCRFMHVKVPYKVPHPKSTKK
eukprot:jgi/Galph1/4821/GphlegSOOS_G3482.1